MEQRGSFIRPLRLAWPRTPPFHGGDTGSNPVGDAILKKVIFLRESGLFSLVDLICDNTHIKGLSETWSQFPSCPSGVRVHWMKQLPLLCLNLCMVRTGGLLREFRPPIGVEVSPPAPKRMDIYTEFRLTWVISGV
jgi:hypothetical protein